MPRSICDPCAVQRATSSFILQGLMRPTFLSLVMISAMPAAAFAQDHHHAAPGFDPVLGLIVLAAFALTALGVGARLKTPAVLGVAVAALGAVGIPSLLPARSFAAHMAEQLFLMDIAAPICVLAWMTAGRARLPVPIRKWRAAATPFGAGILHATVMWGWHIPPLYGAVTGSLALHALMPLTFFAAGLLFWTGILRARGSRPGVALFWLFMTVMHSGLLGALLTFTPTPLYGASITDQHLGGAVMWVMGTLIYAAAGLAVAGRWLAVLDRAPTPEHAA